MLFPDVDGHVIAVKIVQTEAFRNQEDSLSEGKLVDDVLELPEEIDGIDYYLCPNNALPEWFNHLQLLQHCIDIANAAQVHNPHLFPTAVDRITLQIGLLHDLYHQLYAVFDVTDIVGHRIENFPHLF